MELKYDLLSVTFHLLVFLKCFCTGFWALSAFKYSERGHKLTELCVVLKLKTYLIFKSGVVVHSVYHY